MKTLLIIGSALLWVALSIGVTGAIVGAVAAVAVPTYEFLAAFL